MAHRRQVPTRAAPAPGAAPGSKKNSTLLLDGFQQLWRECKPRCSQQRVDERAQALALSSLLCLGRRTVTGLLSTCGLQFADWSAAYRLFSKSRVSTENLFDGVRRSVAAALSEQAPLCLALDDSLFRKTGTKTHGVAWRRDPLGPKFQVNFIRAQRFLQFSAAVPSPEHPQAIRMVPVDFLHCPTASKLGKQATPEQLSTYREACRQANLGTQAISRLSAIHASLPPQPDGQPRSVRLLVDGHYTNRTVLQPLPPHTTLIGRVRKDAKLYYPAAASPAGKLGRHALYGAVAPTPEQLRTDESTAWETLSVFAAGAQHQCRVKTLTGLLWRTSGVKRSLKLVVIAPLHYRLRTGSKLLYRQPAFLLCTDPDMDTQQIVQNYVWRWDIEVNFHEEKSLLGIGQAQVRTPASTQHLPALLIASYAMLLLASIRSLSPAEPPVLLPRPKWCARSNPIRTSTQRIVHQLQAEIWGRGLGLNPQSFSGFPSRRHPNQKSQKLLPSLADAVLYCNA